MARNLYKLFNKHYKSFFRNSCKEVLLELGREYIKTTYGITKVNCSDVSAVKLGRTNNICFNDEKINFDIEVIGSAVFNDMIITPDFKVYAQCEFELDNTVRNFNIIKVHRNAQPMRFLEDGVKANGDLEPIIPKIELEQEAYTFLKKFYPEGITEDRAIPVDRLAKEIIGLDIIEDYVISNDPKVLGRFTLENGEVNGITVKANTILLNRVSLSERGHGSRNYTIAHELYHYWRHRYFMMLRNIVSGDICAFDEVSDYSTDGEWTQIDWIEWQAKCVAAKILMPHDRFQSRLMEYYEKYGFMFENHNESTLYQISRDMAVEFDVSREAAARRIMEIGIFVDGMDIINYMPTTYVINPSSIENNDTVFIEFMASEQFTYVCGRYILNQEKYVKDGMPTNYALDHPDECMICFERNRHYRHISKDNTLYRYDVTEEFLTSAKQNEKLKDVMGALKTISEEDEYAQYIRDDIGLTLKLIREAKNITLNGLSIESGIDKVTLIAFENGESSKISLGKIIKICRAMHLKLKFVKRLCYKLIVNFDDTTETKLIEYVLDNYYDSIDECFVFNAIVDKYVEASKIVNEEHHKMIMNK